MTPDDKNNSAIDNDGSSPQQRAAAQIVRSQIDSIYNQSDDNSDDSKSQADQWRKYHTAWQNYYQKYYEGYYAEHLKKSAATHSYFDKTPIEPVATTPAPEPQPAPEQTVNELRSKLLESVNKSAGKVRRSRHFWPLAAGLFVMLLFIFLQYNSLIIANIIAYVSPGNIDIQNIIVDPNVEITVDPAPRLIIPKINVDVPVVYDIGNDYNSLMAGMRIGVAHFAIPGASSHPGQIGNTVLSGHSSNDLFTVGDYKFIFAQLDKLAVGDSIYANYNSKRYTYTVTGTQIVQPDDVSALVYATAKPILTLITCMPVGTANTRLLVTAEQVSPNPSASTAAPTTSTTKTATSIPGKQPTFLEQLFR